MQKKKPTNKQGVIPNTHTRHHEQGLTCDCRHCGVEFTQYHRGHVMCSEACSWASRGTKTGPMTCSDCGCVDHRPHNNMGYRCQSCKDLRLNPTRTDVTRRTA